MNEPTDQYDAPTVRFAPVAGLIEPPTTPVAAPKSVKPAGKSAFDKRTVMLLAFAAAGLLVLAGVAGYALSGNSSPTAAAGSTTSTSSVLLPALTTAPARVTPTLQAPLPPPPKTSTSSKPATTSVSSPPPPGPPPPPAGGGHLTGTIASKDGTNWTINADGRGPVQVAINASTSFISSKKRSGNQFDVGQPVIVDGQQFGGTLLAATMTAPDPPHSEDPTTTTTTTDPFANPNQQQQQPGYGQMPGYGQQPGYGGQVPGDGGQQPNYGQ